MKKKQLTAAITCAALIQISLTAQNVFPPTGPVGINTASPTSNLEVVTNSPSEIAALYRFRPNNQNFFFAPYVAGGGYNPISQSNDFGIFWNDQANTFDNSNAKSGLIIAPKHGTAQGLRINERGHTGFGESSPSGRIHAKQFNSLANGFYNGIVSEFYTTTPGHATFQYSFLSLISDNKVKCYGVYNSTLAKTTFLVYGDGTTQIGDKIPTGQYADALLSVNGKIVGQSVYVQIANWADYVFKNGYNLRKLEEVEKYISENKHLPDVPSEVEIKESGADLANNDAMLLRKIEELTLYVIELKKELKAQDEKILALEKK